MIDLYNKVAIITGGSKGIGKGTAMKFASLGAKVAIVDIDLKSATDVVGELLDEGNNARAYHADTSDAIAIEAVVQQIFQEFGSIDILINNAGITRDASFKKMTIAQWQQVIDVNLTGVYNVTKAVVPYMLEKGWGRIINAASVVAHYGNFGQTNYVATKAGVIGMTKVWAREFGRKGITVNAVAPGFINTEMVQTIPADILHDLKLKTPLGRLGEVEDIANAYAFLASDAAAFITGTTLNVDGGIVI